MCVKIGLLSVKRSKKGVLTVWVFALIPGRKISLVSSDLFKESEMLSLILSAEAVSSVTFIMVCILRLDYLRSTFLNL